MHWLVSEWKELLHTHFCVCMCVRVHEYVNKFSPPQVMLMDIIIRPINNESVMPGNCVRLELKI